MSRNSARRRRGRSAGRAARRGGRGAGRPQGIGDARIPASAARAAFDDHVFRVRAALAAVNTADIAAVTERLWQAARAGGLVLIAGNGGSAANAAHMAVDLSKSTLGRPPRPGAARVRAVALSDAASVLTAWGNDESYETVFAEQITTLARPEDAVVLLSASGQSPNIVAAARAARAVGALVVALLGGTGGTVRTLADHAVVVPSDDYQVVEDVHLAINHMMTTYIRLALGGKMPRISAAATPSARPARRSPGTGRKSR